MNNKIRDEGEILNIFQINAGNIYYLLFGNEVI